MPTDESPTGAAALAPPARPPGPPELLLAEAARCVERFRGGAGAGGRNRLLRRLTAMELADLAAVRASPGLHDPGELRRAYRALWDEVAGPPPPGARATVVRVRVRRRREP